MMNSTPQLLTSSDTSRVGIAGDAVIADDGKAEKRDAVRVLGFPFIDASMLRNDLAPGNLAGAAGEPGVEVDVEHPRGNAQEIRSALKRQPIRPLQTLRRPVERVQPLHRLQELLPIELERRPCILAAASGPRQGVCSPLVALRDVRDDFGPRVLGVASAGAAGQVDVEDPGGDPEEIGASADRQTVGPLQTGRRHVELVQAVHRGQEVVAIEGLRLAERHRRWRRRADPLPGGARRRRPGNVAASCIRLRGPRCPAPLRRDLAEARGGIDASGGAEPGTQEPRLDQRSMRADDPCANVLT